MSDRVKAILKEIQKLPDDERIELDSALTKLEQRELKRLQTEAGRWAKDNHVDQAAIDAAVMRVRYGRRAK